MFHPSLLLTFLYLTTTVTAGSLRGSTVFGAKASAARRGLTEMILNFNEFQAGHVLTSMDFGVHVSAMKRQGKGGQLVQAQAMIFDSTNPTGGDLDLGTPNRDFNGPGIGKAGRAGSDVENAISHGNVVIISEHNNPDDPDDHQFGGYLLFQFDDPMVLLDVGLLDNEEDTEFDVTMLDGSMRHIVAGLGGDNSYENISFGDFGLVDVKELKVTFGGSGAITHISLEHLGPGEDGGDPFGGSDPFDGDDPFDYGNDPLDDPFVDDPADDPLDGGSDPDPFVDPADDPLDGGSDPLDGGDDPLDGPAVDSGLVFAQRVAPNPPPPPPPSTCEITHFVLWDAVENKPMPDALFEDGQELCMQDMPEKVNFEAATNGNCIDRVDRIKLEMKGHIGTVKNEGVAPYMLAGDKAGKVTPMSIYAGHYTLSAMPNGKKGLQKCINFSVFNCSSR